MINRIKWFERKFNFDYPAGMFPYILERLRGTPAKIEEIIDPLNDKQLSEKINNNWSIKEHIGHIADLEALHEKRLDQLLEKVEILLPADLTNRKTYLADHNNKSKKDLIKLLRKTRDHFTERLASLNEDEIKISALHPRLNKQMRVVDLAFFAAEHDDHHIFIIREITESLL